MKVGVTLGLGDQIAAKVRDRCSIVEAAWNARFLVMIRHPCRSRRTLVVSSRLSSATQS